MADTALIVANNLSHNVSVRIEEAKTSLSHLANVYLVTEVAGQAQATVDAKQRDLQRFLTFYQQLYKHDRPDEWFVSVTKAFVKALHQERLAQASVVRIYATMRHFARWLHRKFPTLFPLGCPTCFPWPGGSVSSSRHLEPCMRFSRTRLTDVVHRRHSASSARPGRVWVRRRFRSA